MEFKMTEELKKEYTRKITHANRSQITVLTFEMALDYIADAENAANIEEFDIAVKRSKKCVEQLLLSLDYKYGLSFTLMRIYNYVLQLYMKALSKRDSSILAEVNKILKGLHDSFEEVSKSDTSAPLMSNAEDVYTGLTYGKSGVNTSVSDYNRGFRV